MEERAAVQRLKRGDIGGLEALVQRYQVRAVRAAFLVTRDRAQAEDIVQTAFLRAYQRIDQFDIRRPFGPWFLRSVVNDAVKAVTRSRQVSLDALEEADSLFIVSDTPEPAAALDDAEIRRTVWDALGALPPEQRAVVVMRYYLDLNEAEMVDALHTPAGTVKWRLHAARTRLRTLLTPFWQYPVDKKGG